jgi:hypothetical protein
MAAPLSSLAKPAELVTRFREQVPCQATSVSARPPDGGRQQTRFRGDRSSDAGPLGSGGGDGGPAMWTRTRVDFGQRTEKLVLVRHPNVLVRSGPIYQSVLPITAFVSS